MMIYGWEHPYNQVWEEIRQIENEGRIIPEEILSAFEILDPLSDRYNEDALYPIFKQLRLYEQFDLRENWIYSQPNDLQSIKDSRPLQDFQLSRLNKKELLNKLHGAWTGRSCGCALGKPVEIVGMSGKGRQKIKDHLISKGDWPLNDYFTGKDRENNKIDLICEKSLRENISYMEPDDDIHYTLIGLGVLEKYGPDFTWRNVADTWNESLPFAAICTAETQAILNYNMKTHWRNRDKGQISSNFTSTYNNPYREWIGAQIRADGWAYCCAGDPEMAAEFAWRDAHWTHRANGIYGEMFAAAMIAAAFCESDPLMLIEIGMSQIPETSHLYASLKEGLIWMKECDSWELYMDRLDARYLDMPAVHTVNNALICAMSIYYGKMDPHQSVSIAVMAGLDTDCNGATVGSITGAACGIRDFHSKYADALNDTIKPLVFGFQEITMAELAKRSYTVWENCRR